MCKGSQRPKLCYWNIWNLRNKSFFFYTSRLGTVFMLLIKSRLIPSQSFQGAWREGSWGKAGSWQCWWHRSRASRSWHRGRLRTFSRPSAPFIGVMPGAHGFAPSSSVIALQICLLEMESHSVYSEPIIWCSFFYYYCFSVCEDLLVKFCSSRLLYHSEKRRKGGGHLQRDVEIP